MLSAIGRTTRHIVVVLLEITEWLGLALRKIGQLNQRGKFRIFWVLFKRQLFNSGLRAASVNLIIGGLLGWLVIANAFLLFPPGDKFIEYYAQFFNVVISREIAPLVSGMILIARSASAVTAEIGHMRFNGELESISAVRMDPAILFLLPVFFSFPIALLLMYFYFNLACILAAYLALISVDNNINIITFTQAVVAQFSYTDIVGAVVKTVVGGLFIGVTCLYYGNSVSDRLTDISRAISKSNTVQIFAFFVLNVSCSYLLYYRP